MIDPRLGYGSRSSTGGPTTTEQSISRFEEATGLRYPADCRELMLDHSGGGLLNGRLAIRVPSFFDPTVPDLVDDYLDLIDLPDGDWVNGFCEFDGLESVARPEGVPVQSNLIRSGFLAGHREWAVSLVPILSAHSAGLFGVLCLDFFDSAEHPPVVFVDKQTDMEPTDPNWEGIWYVAASVTAMLDPSNIEEFDYDAESFPLDIQRDAGLDVSRVPTDAELQWNQQRDVRLGRSRQ